MTKILIVDDEKHMRLILSKILTDNGYKTFQAENGKKAVFQVEQIQPDLILLDYKLPDMNGVEVLQKIRKKFGDISVIMLTAFGDVKHAVSAMKLGAYDYLTKPFDNEEILLIIKKALEKIDLTNEVAKLKKMLAGDLSIKHMMGESDAIKKVLKQVEMVSKSDISVFLQGDTGTGKDLIAKLIHQRSSRNKQPFVAVDCGAIPETLFESEMFGYEKGAFTGANSSRTGKFEQANGGTLFLDEISNLPLNLQPKLLRAIQEKKIQRLAGEKQISVDVRIITASNQDIIDDVKTGKFRSDLFYRIHEFKIELPNLKDRKEDIPPIAKFFLQNEVKEDGHEIEGFTTEAMKELMKYNWPGNIRELRNVVKRAAVMCESKKIDKEHLIFTHLGVEEEMLDDSLTIEDAVYHTKKRVIEKAIEKAGGNKTEAAKILGISRRQLYWELDKINKDE